MSVAAPERVDLPVSGMTCASCARTIERTLAGTAGVERARVNLATNTATIEYHSDRVQVADFIAAIEDLGYGVPKTAAAEPTYRKRLLVAAIFAAPVLVLGMSHRWPWLQLALTAPVVFYCGAPFYVAAWRALRHFSANMNSLIALGTGAAFLYSLWETLHGGHEVYYEAAAAIIALILLGRTLEARARSQDGGHQQSPPVGRLRGRGLGHAIAQVLDGSHEVRNLHPAGLVLDRGCISSQVHAGALHPGRVGESPLDGPRARGASHSGNRKIHSFGRCRAHAGTS